MKRTVITIRIAAAVISLLVLAFSSCQTMQRDILLSNTNEASHGGLLRIEMQIVQLDGANASREEIQSVRRQITNLEGSVADPAFQAMLAAWSGRLFLMEGRNSDAQRELRRSQTLSPHNLPSQVLAFRLERDPARRLARIDESIALDSAYGELLIERGRVLLDLNRFAESVAAFDAAFTLLSGKSFYSATYMQFREKAWELRDLQGSAAGTLNAARQNEITWRDLIQITQSETDLLRFITAGRAWSADAIFNQLVDRAFIPYTQDVSLTEWTEVRPLPTDIVLRAGAAWFLWHLNAENRANRGLLTRYSSRFASRANPRSPVPDIDTNSPFIDSILGCVEWEFMSLPDGRNFQPQQKVRGADFLAMVKRL